MFTRGLSQQTQKNLAIIGKIPFFNRYYLAGGTALSLHFGHRISNDLDFFSQTPGKPITIRSNLKELGKLEIFQNNEGTFHGQLNSVELSFFIYPYKLLKPLTKYNNNNIASVVDIACMKLDAISSRGTKRDFIDLYAICLKSYELTQLLKFYEKKYSEVKLNILHTIKSLVYFDDAEDDEIPQMIDNISWKKIKRYFVKAVKKSNYEI